MGEIVARDDKSKSDCPAYRFTPEQRIKVKTMCECGLPIAQIATYFGITEQTLKKHCREELDKAKAEKSIAIGRKIYQDALEGNTGLLIWWSKTQMGWSETTRQEISGPDGGPVVMGVDGPPKETRAEWEARVQKKLLNGASDE